MYQPYKQDGTRDEPYPHFRFIYIDGEGDKYQTQPMRFPKNFAYNDKAGFWKHVGALLGRTLTEDDAVEIDLGDQYQSWEDCFQLPNLFAKKDEPRPITVKSIKADGRELVAKDSKVQLMFTTEKKKKQDDEGNFPEYSKLASVLPFSAEPGAKKKRAV